MTKASRRFTAALAAAFLLLVCVSGRIGPRAAASVQDQTPDPAETARLAEQYRELYEAGRYDEAIRLAERVLSIYEAKLGGDHELVAETLNNLALIHQDKGDLARAEQLLQRSLAISRKGSGPDLTLLNNIAGIYYERGDYANAEALLLHVLAVAETTLRPDSSERAAALNNLAELYRARGEPTRAEIFLRRAVAILEKSPGANPANLANAYDNLGKAYIERGDDGQGESMLKRGLALREKIYPNGHLELAWSYYGLGALYELKRDYSRAELLYTRALAIAEKTGAPTSPRVAWILAGLATTFELKGETARAVQWQTRANEVREHNLALILSTGSERQKLLYINTLADETNTSVSLSARSRHEDDAAQRLGLTTVLRRKGRALDVWTDQIASLRRRLAPQDRELLDRLTAARARLSRLVLGGGGEGPPAEHLSSVVRLEGEIEELENDISRHSLEFRAQAEPVTVERVQRMIPANAALVEVFSYKPSAPKRKKGEPLYGEPRYIAYVLRREGAPASVDLGEAAAVERAVAEFRRVLSTPRSADVRRGARALDELVMRPVRRLLGGASHLLLSPDGALNLVPFGALVDEADRYLVEGYTITYLTSGRDLLRLDAETEPRRGPLVIAHPAFDAAVSTPARQEGADAGGRGSLDFNIINVSPLPGTAQEAAAIKSIMPTAQVLTGRAATEAVLKQTAGPRVLHIATHGFFLTAGRRADSSARLLVMDEAPRVGPFENPLLRSGLVLAGVTRGQSGAGEDGVLTALEAAGLDLWGTKLVVLSACETGVGDVANGDGVYGLRRSLVLAGAESQAMSLWQVSDSATRDLMADYYRRLERGEGRTEALRAAQLRMMSGGPPDGQAGGADYAHPYYWASFIPVGDWRGIPRSTSPPTSAARQSVPTPAPAADTRPAQAARPRTAAGMAAPAPAEKGKPARAEGPEALVAAGDAEFERGDFTAAASFFERALAARPGDAALRARLGDTYFRRAPPNYDRALAEYRRALAADPRSQRVWHGIAAAALRKGNGLTAADAIGRLSELNPSHAALPGLRAELDALRRR